MKKITLTAALILTLAIITGRLNNAAAAELPPTPVKIAIVKTENVDIMLHGVGHVQGYKEFDIKSRINGKLSKAYITDGAQVKQGEKLFDIDRVPYNLAVDQAEASLERAKAAAAEAGKIADISEKLFKKQIIAKEKMEQQEAEAAELRSAVKVAEADLAIAKQNLSYCTITSPVSGILGRQLLYTGSLITAYQDILITLNQINRIRAELSLPAADLHRLQKFQAEGELEVTIYTQSNPDKKLNGKLNFINNRINPQTGMFTVQAVFENKDNTFWPGEYIHADIRLTTKADTTVIPSRCLFNGSENNKMVYVITEKLKTELRPVELGWYQGSTAIILSGLKKGEKVVTEGIFKLYPTAAVSIIPESKTAK